MGNDAVRIKEDKNGKHADAGELDKKMVRDLIKAVYMHDPEHVEIVWKFTDELMELLKNI